ncbi:hypothetical protein BRADI_2g57107v3 [Brachypodium distachyon]|uniref:GYF domain-containing protein n=1 Tax=Brachypodium distachyon TaxID=15368 RepID=A0A0Q3GII8_BRADI|nr:hypothetical protein BRADI_2g57107v3 [Brachypodium distachyon]
MAMDGIKPRRWGKRADDYMAEFMCFVCMDAGHVRVCDVENCLKAFHPSCVGKKDDLFMSDEEFICVCHTCVNCKRSSVYRCLCCPRSACEECLGEIEFVQVKQIRELSASHGVILGDFKSAQMKQGKGFCSTCLNLTLVLEKYADADYEKARADFGRTEYYESGFVGYWSFIKDQEELTLLDLRIARHLLKRSQSSKEGRDSEKSPEQHRKTDGSSSGDNDNAGETFRPDKMDIPNEVQASLKRRKAKKKTYVGWASKELTDFLSCIGKDTTKPIEHFKVTEVVKEYIRQRNLFQDKKKKSVVCDDNLHSLFSKRKVKYNLIHGLLDTHFAANAISESEDETDGSDYDDGSTVQKKLRNCLEPTILKRVPEVNKRCLASLNQKNLNLIYLRRTLVTKLLGQPDTFEQKVLGCLVRVKNDLKSYSYQMSKKYYQIGFVTGIKRSSEEYKIKDTCTDILFCVSSMWDDVKITMLSEEDFEEDECHDILLTKKEPLKRPTVAELEEKVASVHADIVNHWMDRELLRLEKQIERAFDKGWRCEAHDLLCKQKLLRAPAERQRRLEEIPEVIPDPEEENKEAETESAASNFSQGNRGIKRKIAACMNFAEEKIKDATTQVPVSLETIIEETAEGVTQQVTDPLAVGIQESPEGASVQIDSASEVASQADGKALCNADTPRSGLHTLVLPGQVTADGEDKNGTRHHNEIIDLDGDDDELHAEQREPEAAQRGSPEALTASGPLFTVTPSAPDGPDSVKMWYYMDPQGQQQGPFSMFQLRFWHRLDWFDKDFRVWHIGQKPKRAILVADAVQMIF